jgi:hypothetical protein
LKEPIPSDLYESLQMENGNNLTIVIRLVEVMMRAPILCQRARTIFALLRHTWGERQKDGEFSTKEFSTWTGITGKRASQLINEMIERQIFRQQKVGHRRVLMFNKYYTEWILTEKIRRKRNVAAIPIDYGLKPHVEGEPQKMNKLLQIKMKWNELAERQKDDGIAGFFGIEDIIRADKKLDSAISRRIKEHPLDLILQAIENYDRYLRIPKERRLWHQRWRCHEFFIREKDNISRFMDWNVVEDNWLKKDNPNVNDHKMADSALAFLQKKINADRVKRVLEKIPERLWIQVKMYLVKNHERGEDLYIRIADEVRKNQKEKNESNKVHPS